MKSDTVLILHGGHNYDLKAVNFRFLTEWNVALILALTQLMLYPRAHRTCVVQGLLDAVCSAFNWMISDTALETMCVFMCVS